MRLSDIDEVLEIEKLCFPTPWTRRAFVSELNENVYAHYIVARSNGRLAGYAGMWVILEEAHITNIAVHPAYRRQGLGWLLLHELMERARVRHATAMTLEVRTSNLVAQTMYTRAGFQVRGLRKGYYTDTKEDAIVMWKDDLAISTGARPH
ncbi:MAG TPA: ribosomal-protein-alanine N-acetyltransferase [Clostridiales bacterium UBA8153]|nr:ribosomal-protein-alanine N-acetyltransferase [Clostridiales bacterium UBA8153]